MQYIREQGIINGGEVPFRKELGIFDKFNRDEFLREFIDCLDIFDN